jgi:hypothetical protein
LVLDHDSIQKEPQLQFKFILCSKYCIFLLSFRKYLYNT